MRTDERVRFMDEIISAVQVIKMYAWEEPFAQLVAHTRQMELKSIRKMFNIRVLHMVSSLATNRLALYFTMLGIVYTMGSDQIVASRIFVMSTYFSIVSQLMTNRFPRGINEAAEVMSSLQRIQTFLVLDEKVTETEENKTLHSKDNIDLNWVETIDKTSIFSISMRNLTARWAMPSNETTIDAVMKRQRHHVSCKHQNSQNNGNKNLICSAAQIQKSRTKY